MDELRTVKEAYGEPVPPTAKEMAEARARMFGQPRSRARSGWRVRGGLGVLAVGAAAVAIAAIVSGDPLADDGVVRIGPQGEVELGKEAFLVAAENAAKQETGNYWFSDEVSGQSYVVPAETGPYVIVGAQTEGFRWTGAKPGSATGSAWRMLPARPQTPKDAAAWKKDGSPTKIKAWSGDKWLTLNTAEKMAWEVDYSDPSGGGKWYGRMTTKELQNLPTDPKQLTERFLTDEAMQWRAAGAPSPEKYQQLAKERGALPKQKFDSYSKLGVVGGLVANSPVPPKVRAGLMRAATGVPGVKAIGEVVDPLGRKGVALASASRTVKITGEFGTSPERQGTYQARKELVFDKETGEVLASQYVLTKPGGPYKDREAGFVIDYMAIRDMGWTDAKPKPPAEPPF